MHQAILNKVISHVHVVFIDGDFKRQLIQFESIIRFFTCQSVETLGVPEDNLDVRRGHLHVICLRKDYFVHMLIVVPHAEVEV